MSERIISSRDPEFMAYRKRVKSREHLAQVQGLAYYRDAVDALIDTPISQRGTPLPWAKTVDNIRIRPGELSLWAGKNSHGKSTVLAQVLTWMAALGERVMVASFEMPVAKTIEKMLSQATGLERPTQKVRDEFFKKFDGMFYFYDYEGIVQPDLIMDLCEFSAEVLDCKHIQIDSLTKVKGMVSDKNDIQADFVNNLHASAKHFQTHIHLVAHERKGQGEDGEKRVGSRYSIKGSGAIPDQVDNVFMVWLDKDQKQRGKEDEKKPDLLIRCDKQRHGVWEGYFGLYYSRILNFQFVERMDGRAMTCPNFDLRAI